MRYTVWPDIDHITEETWPTQGLYETFVGKLDAALESGPKFTRRQRMRDHSLHADRDG